MLQVNKHSFILLKINLLLLFIIYLSFKFEIIT